MQDWEKERAGAGSGGEWQKHIGAEIKQGGIKTQRKKLVFKILEKASPEGPKEEQLSLKWSSVKGWGKCGNSSKSGMGSIWEKIDYPGMWRVGQEAWRQGNGKWKVSDWEFKRDTEVDYPF